MQELIAKYEQKFGKETWNAAGAAWADNSYPSSADEAHQIVAERFGEEVADALLEVAKAA